VFRRVGLAFYFLYAAAPVKLAALQQGLCPSHDIIAAAPAKLAALQQGLCPSHPTGRATNSFGFGMPLALLV